MTSCSAVRCAVARIACWLSCRPLRSCWPSPSAGEGALGALERVARSIRGELAGEMGRALADTRSGTALTTALERMADRTGLVSLARFAEAIAVAVDRGTPLADVLHAQAADVREASRRALM